MIKILFPPGAYGSFLSRSIFSFSDLDTRPLEDFDFDPFGSSHSILTLPEFKSAIKIGHIDTFKPGPTDQIISILPCSDYCLDYFDNQWAKQEKEKTVDYILNHESRDVANNKLQQNWNYHKNLNNDTPIWILREWFSFFIADIWKDGYDREKYSSVDCLCSIESIDIFENFLPTIEKIFAVLNLKFRVDRDFVLRQHQKFVSKQKYHNIQKKCNEWCQRIINDTNDGNLECLSIFDQAYLQHILRISGYEIMCDQLNIFPKKISDMRKLIYKV